MLKALLDRLLAVAARRRRRRSAAGDAANGEKIFKRCAACHVARRTRRTGSGPHLQAACSAAPPGTVEGFKYSDAMIQHGKEAWSGTTRPSTVYLEDPKAFVPKNKMAFPGLKKPEERADVIAYLEQATK